MIKLFVLLVVCLWSVISNSMTDAAKIDSKKNNTVNIESKNKNIKVVSDRWCPYLCEIDSEAPGLIIEILRNIYEPYGFNVEYSEIEWSEAVKLTRKGEYDVLLGLYKDDAPDLVFPDQDIISSSINFYVNQSNNWKFKSSESLKTINKILLVSGYSYGSYFDNLFKENSTKIVLNKNPNPLTENIMSVVNGDADTLVDDSNVIDYNLMKYNLIGRLKKSSDMPKLSVWVAFSPNSSNKNDILKIFNNSIDGLKQDKKYSDILLKYGIFIKQSQTNN
jgi:polar amino acid transport system substrate-binding protein